MKHYYYLSTYVQALLRKDRQKKMDLRIESTEASLPFIGNVDHFSYFAQDTSANRFVDSHRGMTRT